MTTTFTWADWAWWQKLKFILGVSALLIAMLAETYTGVIICTVIGLGLIVHATRHRYE